jgi:hypothetical protein
MWVPALVGIESNEAADLEAKQGALGGIEEDTHPIASNHLPLAKILMTHHSDGLPHYVWKLWSIVALESFWYYR